MSANGDEPATKADLQAVKADVQAVKSDLGREIQAVRSELASTEQRLDKKFFGLTKEVVTLQADVRRIQESIPTKADWKRLYDLLDETLGEAKDNRRTLLVFDKALGKNRETLENHEGRIKTLEGKP